MDLSVIVPAYNEQGAIGTVLSDLLSALPKTGLSWELLVVDDCSKDGTKDIVRSFKKVQLIEHPVNKGYGASIKTGARQAKGSWLMLYDADNQFYASDILKFLPFMAQYDMVMGARQGQTSWYRAPGKIMLTRFASYLARQRLPDLNCGFRMVKKSLFDRFVHLYPEQFSITSTLTLAALKSGASVKWVSIPWKPRRTGKSSMKMVRDGWRFMLLVTRLTMLFSPLRVLMPASALLFLAGTSYAIYTVLLFRNIGDFSTLSMLSSLFVFLFGLMSDQIAHIRREIAP